eukprot:TRINITY_DN15_c3_g1_i2.p1 TRINITY_DN15_c3_g1~~TRINITY_DN15_c3_g1_i2.p1  ORF type:complete len:432 (-),score=184.85 TRINITY_DN15_c3_g1_i2:21-1316(-)
MDNNNDNNESDIIKKLTSLKLESSAPGKVILFGEHAVVYGFKAIATSINLRTQICLKLVNGSGKIHLNRPNLKTCMNLTWSQSQIFQLFSNYKSGSNIEPCSNDLSNQLFNFFNEKGLVSFFYLYHLIFLSSLSQQVQQDLQTNWDLIFDINSTLPVGAGLGSSAAYCVSLTAVLFTAKKHLISIQNNNDNNNNNNKINFTKQQLDLINNCSYFAEQIMHGPGASGIDNSVATYGNALIFCKKATNPIQLISSIPRLNILLTNTHVPRDTKVLVQNVRKLYDEYQIIIEPILNSIDNISSTCIQLFENFAVGSITISQIQTKLEELVDINHCLLCALGVGHQSLEQVRKIVQQNSSLHTKLTGAGGGGCTLTLLPLTNNNNSNNNNNNNSNSNEQISNLILLLTQALNEVGFQCFNTTLGVEGVTVFQNYE